MTTEQFKHPPKYSMRGSKVAINVNKYFEVILSVARIRRAIQSIERRKETFTPTGYQALIAEYTGALEFAKRSRTI